MNKIQKTLISYLGAILIFGLSYFLTIDLIVSAIFALISFLILYLHILKLFINNRIYVNKIDEFIHLSNSLITQLTVTPSPYVAFKEISNYFDGKIKDILEDEEIILKAKLELLDEYFSLVLFKIFAQLITIYSEQGGNIIEMSLELLNQIDYLKTSSNDIMLDNKKKITEVMILWLLSIGSVCYIKVILNSYYLKVVAGSFKYVICLFIISFIGSLFAVSKTYCKMKI